MISLYPSHIHISFTYPYILHIHKFFIIFAGCPATCFFPIFHFYGVKAGCVFLVIFWCRCCGCFSTRSSTRLSFRFSLRFALRLDLRLVSSVSFLAPPFVQPLISFVRLGVSGGRFVGRAVFVSSSWRAVRLLRRHK